MRRYNTTDQQEFSGSGSKDVKFPTLDFQRGSGITYSNYTGKFTADRALKVRVSASLWVEVSGGYRRMILYHNSSNKGDTISPYNGEVWAGLGINTILDLKPGDTFHINFTGSGSGRKALGLYNQANQISIEEI